MELTKKQLDILIKAEDEIYDCGIDGGESTSEAIYKLHRLEKEFSVFNLDDPSPRWTKDGGFKN